jgi:hypothetical protein
LLRAARLSLLLFALGCSSAMKVQKAPGLGVKPYRHVVVAVGIDHLDTRKLAEDAFASERASDADVIPSVSILEAGRGYEPDEMQRALTRGGADAVAIVSVVRMGRDSVKYGPTTQPALVCLLWAGRTCRQYGVARSTAADDVRPWMRFNVELYEMASGRMLWSAEVRTTGRNTDTPEVILRRLAHDVVQGWQKDGVLAKPGSLARR